MKVLLLTKAGLFVGWKLHKVWTGARCSAVVIDETQMWTGSTSIILLTRVGGWWKGRKGRDHFRTLGIRSRCSKQGVRPGQIPNMSWTKSLSNMTLQACLNVPLEENAYFKTDKKGCWDKIRFEESVLKCKEKSYEFDRSSLIFCLQFLGWLIVEWGLKRLRSVEINDRYEV